MNDIRQSEQYANYLRSYGWIIQKAGRWNIFIKNFPLIGSLIKAQRITPPIPFKEIEDLAKKYRAFRVIIEPSNTPNNPNTTKIPKGFRTSRSPFLPTKTLILDLKKSEKETINSFPKEKRRLLKKIREKKEIIIKEGTPEDFIKLKSRGLLEKHILPIGTKKEINTLWQSFSPDNIKILIANSNLPNIPNVPNTSKLPPRPIAGALFLFFDKKAYYWQASSLKKGNLFGAPSLLVWEGIKLAKKLKCRVFDFEGIYDQRFPIRSWKGFSLFKRQFGGKEKEFPNPIEKSFLRLL